jgi:hypothetical protein
MLTIELSSRSNLLTEWGNAKSTTGPQSPFPRGDRPASLRRLMEAPPRRPSLVPCTVLHKPLRTRLATLASFRNYPNLLVGVHRSYLQPNELSPPSHALRLHNSAQNRPLGSFFPPTAQVWCRAQFCTKPLRTRLARLASFRNYPNLLVGAHRSYLQPNELPQPRTHCDCTILHKIVHWVRFFSPPPKPGAVHSSAQNLCALGWRDWLRFEITQTYWSGLTGLICSQTSCPHLRTHCDCTILHKIAHWVRFFSRRPIGPTHINLHKSAQSPHERSC